VRLRDDRASARKKPTTTATAKETAVSPTARSAPVQ
jgi:hypothetical protein